MRWIRPFLIALQFLTCLPVQLREAPTESEIGRSVVFYPVVGLLIGILLASLVAATSAMHISGLLSAALVLATWAFITGGLHLDGLADSADAWVGGRGERERTLAIMKDPRCGPMAVTTVVVVLLIKFAALAALTAIGNGLLVMLAPVLGRTVLPLLFLTIPYVRPGGLGSAMSAHLHRPAAVTIVVAACGSTMAFFGWVGFSGAMAAIAMFFLLRRMMMARLGGTTGDTAGAMVEMVETVAITVMASFYG